jgi:hypothetical protein
MNLVTKSSRGKVAEPSEHVLVANASNTAKIHKKQVTLQPEKRARYRHHEPNIDQPSGLHCGVAIESNHLKAVYVHHTLKPSSCLCSESSLTLVALPETKRA